jgi:hypothetical protein
VLRLRDAHVVGKSIFANKWISNVYYHIFMHMNQICDEFTRMHVGKLAFNKQKDIKSFLI